MIRLIDCSYAADYKQIDLKMQGKYDNLITYKGKLAYFININETKEPTE